MEKYKQIVIKDEWANNGWLGLNIFELVVFALIYNKVEIRTKDIMAYTGIERKKFDDTIRALKERGLVVLNSEGLWEALEDEVEFE